MKFDEKLERVKDEIIEEAQGITCLTCEHARFDCGNVGYCACKGNVHVLHGTQITISSWAPKCAKYEQKS